MGTLQHSEILKLHGAVLSSGLVDSREALLAGVQGNFIAGLASAATPSAQILRDLTALNEAGTLQDGSIPLELWLRNAIQLAGPLTASAIFRKTLNRQFATPQPVDRDNAEEQAPSFDWKHPGAVLVAAVKAVPVVKYALGVASVAAVVTIVTRGFGLDRGTAVVGTTIVIALMVLLLVLTVAARQQRLLRMPAVVMTWSFLVMAIGGSALLLVSFFFHYPKSPRCLFYDQCVDMAPSLTDEPNPKGGSGTPPTTPSVSAAHTTSPVVADTVPAPTTSASSPSVSYRGTLRDRRNGQAIVGARVFLAGTSCKSTTDDDGGFDFSRCKDDRIPDLRDPRIHIALQPTASQNKNWWDCRDIKILKPPDSTEIKFDPDKCAKRPLTPGSPPIAQTPSADVQANCISDSNCGPGARCVNGDCIPDGK